MGPPIVVTVAKKLQSWEKRNQELAPMSTLQTLKGQSN
jgi:hypothetical protein